MWHDIMQKAMDNALTPSENGLPEEKIYDERVSEYAQAQVMYHGTQAGLKWQDLQNGVIVSPKPVAGFVRWVNQLWNSSLLAQERETVEATRQHMVDAHEDYVRAAIAMYGPQR